jgi:bacteriocin biosynthesis cyclodehydratase domain-containing protein
MNPPRIRRPRLALPFTVMADGDTVRLVAGEDFRYSLSGPDLGQWLPALLAGMNGKLTIEDLLSNLGEPYREPARSMIGRLYGERVLIDGSPAERHQAGMYRLAVEGSGALAESLQRELATPTTEARPMHLLCQDSLDYESALRFNRQRLSESAPWMWASTGAMSRGYVSPVFLPDAGPCLACLVRQFQRLSPAPEIYDELREHVRRGAVVEPVPFSWEGVAILQQLIKAKQAWLTELNARPALYQLHVLETATLEISIHRVFPDPGCPDCGERR